MHMIRFHSFTNTCPLRVYIHKLLGSRRISRGKNAYLSTRMKEAWAEGKYANRRPKGQGLKKGEKKSNENYDSEDEVEEEEEV